MIISEREIIDKVSTLGLSLPAGASCKLRQFGALLMQEGQKLNLTGIPPEEMVEKHFVDSLSLLLVPELATAGSLADIGTGAGFPGIPVKIVRPELMVALVDARAKRVDFLRTAVDRLGLQHIACYHSRAELLGQDGAHREQYDIAVARAVAPLPILVEYLLPLVRIGGVAVAMKGPGGEKEAADCVPIFGLLGGRLQRIIHTALPRGDIRQLVVMDKLKPTKSRYPRQAGQARKRPLGRS